MFGNIVGGVEMESWTNKLAKKIKGFENPNPIGSIIGEVVKPMPELTISVMDGQVILYPEQLYINTLLTAEYVRSFEIKDSTFETFSLILSSSSKYKIFNDLRIFKPN